MFLQTSYLEWAANILTALCIYLAGRNKVLTWPVGIIATCLFGVLFYKAGLFADSLLQVFFIATGIIGWMGWKNNKIVEEIPTHIDVKKFVLYSVIAISVAIAYGYFLLYRVADTFDAYVPFVDSLILTLSILGQLLLMRKKIETWMVWIVVNIISVPLYFSRDLYLTSFMYSLFLINAVVSYFYWKKLMGEKNVTV